jgi:transcription antitermination factor NusG
MTSSASSIRWFALYVKPKHEKVVTASLRGKAYETLLPLYTCRSRSKTSRLPLFPGYAFARFDASDRLPVLIIPGVLSVVRCGGVPAPIDDVEIESLRTLANSGLRAYPWPQFQAGQKVLIKEGPLRGVEAIYVRERDSGQLIVSVTLLQRSVAVDVEPGWLEPARPAPTPRPAASVNGQWSTDDRVRLFG